MTADCRALKSFTESAIDS